MSLLLVAFVGLSSGFLGSRFDRWLVVRRERKEALAYEARVNTLLRNLFSCHLGNLSEKTPEERRAN